MKDTIPISFLVLILILVPFLGCNNFHGSKSHHYRNSQVSSTRDIYSDSILKYIKYNYPTLALMHVNVVDGTGAVLKEDQTIVIKHGLFEAIGGPTEIKVPRNAKILDLKGKTIIPGIVGMHNHLHIPRFPDVGDVAAKLYLASGVTTIQTCGAASPNNEIALSNTIEKGMQIGPDIIPSAPFITGKGGNPNMIIPRNEKHLRDTMQHYINQGIKWFKVYRNTNPDDLKVIIDEAHKNNCKVRGHLCSITFEEATKWGIDGIEHGLNSTSDFRTDKTYGICNGGREYMDELIIENPKVKALQQLIIDNDVFLTSTLSIYEASIPNRAYADERTLKAMSPFLLDRYKERRDNFDKSIKDTIRNNRLKRIMQFEYQYYKNGRFIMCGCRCGQACASGFW